MTWPPLTARYEDAINKIGMKERAFLGNLTLTVQRELAGASERYLFSLLYALSLSLSLSSSFLVCLYRKLITYRLQSVESPERRSIALGLEKGRLSPRLKKLLADSP